MSYQYYNFLQNNKLNLDSFENENSLDEDEYYNYDIEPILTNLILKLRKLFIKRVSPFWNNFKTFYYDHLQSQKSHFINYEYILDDSHNQNITNNYNISNLDFSYNQDIDDNNEQVIKIIKIEILKSKLLSLFNIIKIHLDEPLLKFMERLKLKVEIKNLFNKDDNYLYFLPKPKLFRFRTIYAYRRLIYVIKSYKYRVNIKLRLFFMKWRDLIIYNIPKFEIKSKKDNSSDINIVQKFKKFNIILNNIFDKFYHNQNLFKLSFYYLKYKGRENIDRYNFIEILKKLNILENKVNYCFNFKRKEILDILIKKYYNKNSHSNKNLLNTDKIEHAKNILKGLLMIYVKNWVNKSISKRFYKWRKIIYKQSNTSTNKTNSFLSNFLIRKKLILGLKIISNIIYKNKKIKIVPIKRKFFQKMLDKLKFRNSLKEYGIKYKKFPNFLYDGDLKSKVYLLRNLFEKQFGLQKIFLQIIHKKYSFNYSNSKKYNFHLNYNNMNDNAHNALILCFYKWKKIVIQNYREASEDKWILTDAIEKINNKRNINFKNDFIHRLKVIIKNKNKTDNNYIQNLSKLIFLKFKTLLNDNIIIAFNKIKYNYLLHKKFKINIGTRLIRLFQNYTKANLIKNNKTKNVFNRWKLLSGNNKFDKSILASSLSIKILKLKFIISKKYAINLKFFFNKFKFNARAANKKVFVKSKHIPHIDFYLIENQSKILLDFEKEENKLNNEILKYKFLTTKKSELILLFLNKKQSTILKIYFKKWKIHLKKDNEESKEDLIIILNNNLNIQNENEELIKIYRNTKRNYKKTIEDFEDVKTHFCPDCIGEELEIDYKSVNEMELSEDEEEGNFENEKEDNLIQNNEQNSITTSMLDEDFKLDSRDEYKKLNTQSLGHKVSEMETQIKNLQNIHDNKVYEFQNQIKTFEEKKSELLAIKEKILKAIQK